MSESLLSNNPAEDIAPVSPFGAIDYGVTADELERLAGQFGDITQITNVQEQKAAQAAVTKLTRARTGIEARRKELKSESLAFGKLVDSTAKELAAVVTPEEQRIKAMLDEIKAKQEAKRAEAARIEQERIDGIRSLIEGMSALPEKLERAGSAEVKAAIDELEQRIILETEFAEFTTEASEVKAGSIGLLQELYQGALHDERLAKEKAEQQAREDAERKAEDERLAKERKALAEQQAKADAEQAKRDAEIKAQQDALAAQQAEIEAEKQRLAAEEKARQDAIAAEEKAKADELEARRKADEIKAKMDAMRPDVEKLVDYSERLAAVAGPGHLETEEAKAVMDLINQKLSEIHGSISVLNPAQA